MRLTRRSPRTARRPSRSPAKGKSARTLLLGAIAAAIVVGAYVMTSTPAPTTGTPPTPPRTARPTTPTSPTPPSPTVQAQTKGAPAPPEVELPTEPVRFAIQPVRARIHNDPIGRYLRLAAPPPPKKPLKPTVPMPPTAGAFTPWIESWARELTYVGYIAGRHSAAVVRTPQGEVVVHPGEPFPGEPRVLVVRITPKRIVLRSNGDFVEVHR